MRLNKIRTRNIIFFFLNILSSIQNLKKKLLFEMIEILHTESCFPVSSYSKQLILHCISFFLVTQSTPMKDQTQKVSLN